MFDNSEEVKKWFALDGDNTLRLNYPLDTNSIVFDVGAYKGEWGKKIHEKYNSIIHMFEPVGEHIDYLRREFTDDKFIINNFGLGGYSRTTYISLVGRNLDGSTFLKDTTSTDKELAFILDATKYILESHIITIDLMKLNVEGLEFEILENIINSGMVKNIKYIQIQFHNFAENSIIRRDYLRSLLKRTHEEMYNFPFVWESWKIR